MVSTKTRKRICILLVFCLLLTCLVGGCSCDDDNSESNNIIDVGKSAFCSVTYIDVGQGDCIFIALPDNKCALIDTGDRIRDNHLKIEKFLTDRNVTKIDYLFLTHTDIDHIGNAYYLIEKFEIGMAYLPYAFHGVVENLFPEFDRVYDLLESKNVEIKISQMLLGVKTDDYVLTILSPEPHDFPNGLYADININNVTKTQVNNISAVIYFECKGVRFLFMADAQEKVEKIIIDRYRGTTIYQEFHANLSVDFALENIDYLKVAHHGSSDATSKEFLDLVTPKNAIISVGGDNIYSHPSTDTIDRILATNSLAKIYRTDECGSVMVSISDDSSHNIVTEL